MKPAYTLIRADDMPKAQGLTSPPDGTFNPFSKGQSIDEILVTAAANAAHFLLIPDAERAQQSQEPH